MSLIIQVKAMPSSGRNEWALAKNNQVRCYLKAPPERGKANEELIKSLARALKLPLDKIAIVSGFSTQNKRIKIETDLTYDEVLVRLGLEDQKKLF
jgi:uncharacterized protein